MHSKSERWALTGATGFVGQALLRQWEREALPINIVALCRSRSLARLAERTNTSGAKLDVIAIEDYLSGEAKPTFDTFVHLAASTKWSASEAQATEANFELTQSLVDAVATRHPQAKFVYCSTAMTQPYATDIEATLRFGDRSFRNYYELSKYRAEDYLAHSTLSHTIVRPPLITGERGSGWCQGFQGLYHLLRLFARGYLPALPGIPTAPINAVPCDEVVNAILDSTRDRGSTTVELAVRGNPLTLRRFMELGGKQINTARRGYGLAVIASPRYVSVEQWLRIFRPILVSESGTRIRDAVAILDHFLPYINIRQQENHINDPRYCDVDENYFSNVIGFWIENNNHLIQKEVFDWSKGFKNEGRSGAGKIAASS